MINNNSINNYNNENLLDYYLLDYLLDMNPLSDLGLTVQFPLGDPLILARMFNVSG